MEHDVSEAEAARVHEERADVQVILRERRPPAPGEPPAIGSREHVHEGGEMSVDVTHEGDGTRPDVESDQSPAG